MSSENKRPPYLALTLDAKKKIPPTARAAGTDPGSIAWGLLEMWEHVRITKKDVLSAIMLDGFFGMNERLREALVEFGWLERMTDDRYRVRGAEDFLNIHGERSEAASRAGKASAAAGKSLRNLKQNAPKMASEAVRTDLPNDPPNAGLNDPLAHTFSTAPAERPPNEAPNGSERPPNHSQQLAPNSQQLLEAAAAGGTEQLALTPPDPRTDDPERLRMLWNELAHPDLPRWSGMSKKRRAAAKARLEERSLGHWGDVIRRVNASSFLRGGGEKGWRASPDWLLQPDSADKVLEGKYDDRSAPAAPPEPAATAEPTFGESPAGQAWRSIWEAMSAGGKLHARDQLVKLVPLRADGPRLTFACPDRYFSEWVTEHYAGMLTRFAKPLGFTDLQFVTPEAA